MDGHREMCGGKDCGFSEVECSFICHHAGQCDL